MTATDECHGKCHEPVQGAICPYVCRAAMPNEGTARDIEMQHLPLITGQLVSNPDGTIVGAMEILPTPPTSLSDSSRSSDDSNDNVLATGG